MEIIKMKDIRHKKYIYTVVSLCIILVSFLLQSCSSTRAIPEGEQLFTGLKKIKYTNYEKNDHAAETQMEMESVLASAPTGSLFGSSYYRTLFPVRLWIWNAFSQSNGTITKWFVKAFGSRPKLLSQVNPALRAQIAEQQLHNYGYFGGKVSYKTVIGHHRKEAKIAYTVDMGHLWTLDSIDYVGFTPPIDSLMQVSHSNTLLHVGDPFMVGTLESERQRLTNLLRNQGFYYYEGSDASYLADTLNVSGKVRLHYQMVDSLNPLASHPWYIGKVDLNFRKQFNDTLSNSFTLRNLTVHFNGRKPPVRAGVVLHGMYLRPHRLYSYDNEELSRANLHSTGLFSYSNFTFTPRDTSLTCDTLDMKVDLLFDKPYSFYVKANAKGQTTGRMGPEVVLGMTKQNALHGGEVLDVNLNGSYEWQTGHRSENSTSSLNSYEYGADVSLMLPRLLTPWNLFAGSHQHFRRPRHFRYAQSSTTFKISTDVLNRAGYFKRHVVSGEVTYDWYTSESSHHSFTPLSISYQYMQGKTASFDSLLQQNPYLQISMRNQFVPKMSYTYIYASPAAYKSPVIWSSTVSEAGNVLAAGYAIAGEKWNTKNKTMFKNPYAQFLKIETDFVKQWHLSAHSSLVGHLAGGIIWSYGNASQAPYYEQFYVGGANSIRAFNVRSIGPGRYYPPQGRFSYIDQTGDIKLLGNLEYRPRLWGSLYGALFLDAGNVWGLHDDPDRPDSKFEFKNFARQIAVGTGVGLRYDMGMFVIRLDWGVGLHVPYDTGSTGFYNVSSFRDTQSIHLAIGYPF
jgi:hypothetical protein